MADLLSGTYQRPPPGMQGPMAGDKDDSNSTENIREYSKCAKAIHNAQLSIIPVVTTLYFFANFRLYAP